MNSNHLLNLPAPISSDEPVRYQDIQGLTAGGSITFNNVPTGGSAGEALIKNSSANYDTGWSNVQKMPAGGSAGESLTKNSSTDYDVSWTNTSLNTFVSVKNFGAKGDGITDDTAAFNAAINSVFAAHGGGQVYVPEGVYYITSTLNLFNITLRGSGRTSCYITCGSIDTTIINYQNGQNIVDGISFFGKGIWNINTGAQGDPGSFGSSHPVINVASSGSVLSNCQVFGGNYAVFTTGTDCLFFNNYCSNSYGQSIVYTAGSSWYIRNIFDHNNFGATGNTNTYPFEAWSSNTSYTKGFVVSTQNFYIQCVTAGTSGAVEPSLKNYTVPMNDGTAVWNVVAPVGYFAMFVDTDAGENYFNMVDFTSNYQAYSLVSNQVGSTGNFPALRFTNCIFSSNVSISHGASTSLVQFSSCSFGNTVGVVIGYAGYFNINNCSWSDAADIEIGAGVSNFMLNNNMSPTSGAINIGVGSSNNYIITNNIGFTVTDGGTGTHKTITGNLT